MNVLSLFDGISCAYAALERAGIPVKSYTAVEIEKNAIAISKKNYPEIIRHDDVRTFHSEAKFDLLIGGSPCVDLSIAKKDRQGLEGSHSSLFWEYVRIKNECKPTCFILENVASMPKKDKDIITEQMGVEPVMINAALVSAQNRKRLFWTNIPFDLPVDRGILLKDILQPESEVAQNLMVKKESKYTKANLCEDKSHTLTATMKGAESNGTTLIKVGYIGNGDAQANRVYDPNGKSSTLSANGGGLGAKTGLYDVEDRIRRLTPIECERLQGLPDNYTEGVVATNRYKCLGNAFNVDVVACILTGLK